MVEVKRPIWVGGSYPRGTVCFGSALLRTNVTARWDTGGVPLETDSYSGSIHTEETLLSRAQFRSTSSREVCQKRKSLMV
jgi:hypothetical protein